MTEKKKEATLGRPRGPGAKTSYQRVKDSDDAWKAAGGRILNRVRINPEAASALTAAKQLDGSERAAIENALIKYSKGRKSGADG